MKNIYINFVYAFLIPFYVITPSFITLIIAHFFSHMAYISDILHVLLNIDSFNSVY